MEWEEFQKSALLTESKKESIEVKQTALVSILKSFIYYGNLLDEVKKNAFYGKPISDDSPYFDTDFNDEALKIDGVNTRLFHAMIGTMTESTELAEAMLKSIESKTELDVVNVAEEYGDLDWYAAIFHDASKISKECMNQSTIDKLKIRFKDKFTDEEAVDRALDEERDSLEKYFLRDS